MKNIKLSAVIITLNEEHTIFRCIQSLRGVVDEIIVVDSFSTDATEIICKREKVTFIQNKYAGYIEQQNFARDQATHDYVLSIDADEALSEELKSAILKVKSNWDADAYSMNRLTNYCGHWIKHSGWYPDRKTRLWNRTKGNWGGENPHGLIIMDNPKVTVHVKGDLLHYSFPSIHSHIKTLNNFSDIGAQEAYKKGKKSIFLLHIILNPLFTFIKKYFFQLGFLDGYYGFVVCWISAFANFIKYIKLRELENQN